MLLARENLRANKMVVHEIDRWWHVFAKDKQVEHADARVREQIETSANPIRKISPVCSKGKVVQVPVYQDARAHV